MASLIMGLDVHKHVLATNIPEMLLKRSSSYLFDFEGFTSLRSDLPILAKLNSNLWVTCWSWKKDLQTASVHLNKTLICLHIVWHGFPDW